jgi:hypothetical protein
MSTNLTVTRNQVILAAFRKLGIVEPQDTIASIDPTLVTNASFNLNLIIKQMATKGIKLWTIQEYAIQLVAGASVYGIYEGAIAPDLNDFRPIKLIQAWLNNISVTPIIRTPLRIISQQEYNLLGSPSSTGTSNSVYLEKLIDSSYLYVFLTPDATTEDNYELRFLAQRQIQDLTAPSTILDFPNEWYNALVWSLADDLAIEFEVPVNHRQEFAQRASTYRDQLEEWDVEYASTFFTVSTAQNNKDYG